MAKLAGMGCPITRDQIMTSGDVTIRYLQTHYPDKTVYLVGTPPLVESFAQAGIPLVEKDPDIVVIGFDTTLTYQKLSNACTFIRQGVAFPCYPSGHQLAHRDRSLLPDCGSLLCSHQPFYRQAAQVSGQTLCRDGGDGAG